MVKGGAWFENWVKGSDFEGRLGLATPFFTWLSVFYPMNRLETTMIFSPQSRN